MRTLSVIRSPVFLVLAAWTGLALIFAAHNYLTFAANGRPIPLPRALWWSVAEWYTWLVLTPLVVWLARRFRLDRQRFGSSVVALASLGVVVATAQVILEFAADEIAVAIARDVDLSVRVWLADGARGVAMELAYLLPCKIGFSYVTFWAVVLVAHTVEFYRMYRDREVRTARAEAALATAQLHALESQLHPHFLFNTLNSIASLIPEDPVAAEEMVESLSELLQATLRRHGVHEIPLAEELALADEYLRIQERRFSDRLRVERVIDPGLLDVFVPPLILQPLVENAIRHGIAPRRSGGTLSVRARSSGDLIALSVEDDGVGFDDTSGARHATGLGIANTRARLEQLYGRSGIIDVRSREMGGTVATVSIPLRRGRDRAKTDAEL